jgi:hypothetical protein
VTALCPALIYRRQRVRKQFGMERLYRKLLYSRLGQYHLEAHSVRFCPSALHPFWAHVWSDVCQKSEHNLDWLQRRDSRFSQNCVLELRTGRWQPHPTLHVSARRVSMAERATVGITLTLVTVIRLQMVVVAKRYSGLDLAAVTQLACADFMSCSGRRLL